MREGHLAERAPRPPKTVLRVIANFDHNLRSKLLASSKTITSATTPEEEPQGIAYDATGLPAESSRFFASREMEKRHAYVPFSFALVSLRGSGSA
jgi:hypothetical protein